MEKENQLNINPNNAELADLLALPGVGEILAQRIMAGRPYQTTEDMLRIKGLGEQGLERMRPFLAIAEVQEDKTSKAQQNTGVDSGGHKPVERPTLEERLKGLGWSPKGSAPTSTQVLWLTLITGAMSVIVSVILSLAILAGINRTLNVERHAAVRDLRSNFSQMESQMGDLAADLASIDQRLNAVEGLSGRMATLETEFELVQEDVDQAVIEVDRLTDQMTGISDEVMRISGKVDLFDAFLEGLRALMADLFAPIETIPSP